MADTISTLIAVPSSIANDGSETSVISASVLTDGAPAAAGVAVTWIAQNGDATSTSSSTDATGTATMNVTAKKDATAVVVTASTADDSKTVTLQTYQPLAAPIVVNADADDGYVLDYYDINFGVQAEIPIYTGVDVGQTVTFNWGDVDSTSFIITEETHPPFVIDVTENLSPDCLKDGNYNIYYVVVDQAGNSSSSSIVPIVVQNSGSTVPTLVKPTVAEADPYINIADASDGVIATVVYPVMVVGDVVTFYWDGYDSLDRRIDGAQFTDSYTLIDGDISVDFTVPMDNFYPNGTGYEGYAEAYYTVTVADQSALELSESLQCLVDTVAP